MVPQRHTRVSELEPCLDGEPRERVSEGRQDVLSERQLCPRLLPKAVPEHGPRRRGKRERASRVVGQLGLIQELAGLGRQGFGLVVVAPGGGEQRSFAERDHLCLRRAEALGLQGRLGEEEVGLCVVAEEDRRGAFDEQGGGAPRGP